MPPTLYAPNSTLTSQDYRESHIRNGEAYEEELRQIPIDAYMSKVEERVLHTVARELFPHGIKRYVDFACGTGRITRLLEPLAAESIGIDVSAPMLETARKQCGNTRFLLCDLTRETVNIGTGRADLITAFRFFGNAQDELRRSTLIALRRLVSDEGCLILNNHRNPASLRNLLVRLTGGPLADYRGRPIDLTYWKLEGMLEQAGFRVLRSYGVGFWLVRAALEKPGILQSRLARLLEPVSRFRPLVPFCPDAVIVAVPTSTR